MSKRQYGTGSITQKGKGRWQLRIDLGRDELTGARRRRATTFTGTKTAARRELERWRAELQRAPSAAWQHVTIGQWLQQWHQRRVDDGQLAPRTVGTAISIINRHLIPTLGRVSLAELKRAHVEDLVRSLVGQPKSLSPATVRRVMAVLSGALEDAVRGELIDRNPAKGVQLPALNGPAQREKRILEPDEIRALVEAGDGTEAGRAVRFALATGVRESELLGARWADLDFNRGTFRVRRTLHLVDGRLLFGIPKSAKGRRTIELSAATLSMLREHRVLLHERRLRVGAAWEGERWGHLLFPDVIGRGFRRDAFQKRVYAPLVRGAGLEDPASVDFPTLRHTAASLWIRDGVDVATVSRRLGHQKSSFTIDVYGHLFEGQQGLAATALDRVLA